jgi:hypothetical protein
MTFASDDMSIEVKTDLLTSSVVVSEYSVVTSTKKKE